MPSGPDRCESAWGTGKNSKRDSADEIMQSSSQTAASQSLANEIVDQIESVLGEAEEKVRPLELDPYRSRLFELFVMADAAGFLTEGAEIDLTADEILRELAQRWGLATAAQQSFHEQRRLPPEHLGKMRLLWSFLRMWMEWTYAWQRWPEFHGNRCTQ